MAEVGTGQGKSIILAILSTYLALVGFNVRCVCYSIYLTSRDQESFRFLFDFFDISDKVKYGTFNNVCEQLLNTGDNDFKAEVYHMIMRSPKDWVNKISNFFFGTTFSKKNDSISISKTPTILLVDEADIFFDSDFYGQCFRPSIKLKGPEISSLLNSVWQLSKQHSHKSIHLFKQVKQSPEFKAIIKKYDNLKKVLENQLNAILVGAFNYKHDYFILEKRQKLVYRENDSINEKLSYGYKTVFANLYEYERKNISKTNLDEALCIELIVAEFSYAILPKMFKHIIGVTGTLNSMPNFKKAILRDSYDVTNNFLIPSSFGVNEKKIHNFFQVEQRQLYDKIIESIRKIEQTRPIIIFFKSANNLYDFNNYAGYSAFNSRTLILTEQHDSSYRERIVFMATQAGKITLMTKSFGRGTDFQIFDPKVNEKGGVHIIQTFLSLDQSEEIQIMGRTNRQNSNGSYDAIFKSNELEALKITQDFTKTTKEQIFNNLSTARERLVEEFNEDIKLVAQISEQKHKKVDSVYSNKKLKQEELIEYITQINQCKKIGKETIRTVVGIDGTGSMAYYLSKVISILKQTFSRTYKILQEQSVSELNVEIMVMVYRNYNVSPAQLLESTPFENNLDNLINFLSKVQVAGGLGNQAIQVYFQALNKLEDVSQAILIGDMGWNRRQQVKNHRNGFRGDSQWTSNGFPPTYAEDQLAILRSKSIPIHTYYVGQCAKINFEQISTQTSGKAKPWPRNVYKPAQVLSDFISRQIMKLGDEKMKKNGKNTNLEEAYVKMYP